MSDSTPAGQRPDNASAGRLGYLVTVQHNLRIPANDIIRYSRELLAENPPRSLQNQLLHMVKAGESLRTRISDLTTRGNADSGIDAVLQHELHTDMHVLLGFADQLTLGSHTPEPKQIQRILSAASDLKRKIESLDGADELELEDEPVVQSAATANEPMDIDALMPQTEVPDVEPAHVLVVDDDPINRELLSSHLKQRGFAVSSAPDGVKALQKLKSTPFDLVLLDLIMPEMDGYETLVKVRADPLLNALPVIVISAIDDVDSIARCLQLGANDHLPKTFNPVLLDARLTATLDRKRLRDREQADLKRISQEQERSDRLLQEVLPAPIARRLKQGEVTIADAIPDASVLFCDICGFTTFAESNSPIHVAERLGELFEAIDDLVDRHGVEKIKTIGDAYLAVSGVLTPRDDHAVAMVRFAEAMLNRVKQINLRHLKPFDIRVGIHSGPLVGGVIGRKRLVYDVWGDTVNVASRMESQGEVGRIHVSDMTRNALGDRYQFERRRRIRIKGRAKMYTYLLKASAPSA